MKSTTVPMNMINATAKIGPKSQFHVLSPNLSQPYTFVSQRKTLRISCLKENDQNLTGNDALAVELSLEIKKFKFNMVQREEALDKSREILYTEVCNFTRLNSDDFKKKWGKMNEHEKWVMTKEFVAMWSDHFHPLSARSVKEMVDEYLAKNDEVSADSGSDSGKLFPGLRKLLGFS